MRDRGRVKESVTNGLKPKLFKNKTVPFSQNSLMVVNSFLSFKIVCLLSDIRILFLVRLFILFKSTLSDGRGIKKEKTALCYLSRSS